MLFLALTLALTTPAAAVLNSGELPSSPAHPNVRTYGSFDLPPPPSLRNGSGTFPLTGYDVSQPWRFDFKDSPMDWSISYTVFERNSSIFFPPEDTAGWASSTIPIVSWAVVPPEELLTREVVDGRTNETAMTVDFDDSWSLCAQSWFDITSNYTDTEGVGGDGDGSCEGWVTDECIEDIKTLWFESRRARWEDDAGNDRVTPCRELDSGLDLPESCGDIRVDLGVSSGSIDILTEMHPDQLDKPSWTPVWEEVFHGGDASREERYQAGMRSVMLATVAFTQFIPDDDERERLPIEERTDLQVMCLRVNDVAEGSAAVEYDSLAWRVGAGGASWGAWGLVVGVLVVLM